jgi:hypothetical protein
MRHPVQERIFIQGALPGRGAADRGGTSDGTGVLRTSLPLATSLRKVATSRSHVKF